MSPLIALEHQINSESKENGYRIDGVDFSFRFGVQTQLHRQVRMVHEGYQGVHCRKTREWGGYRVLDEQFTKSTELPTRDFQLVKHVIGPN